MVYSVIIDRPSETDPTPTYLDVRRLLCPLPVIRTQQIIKSLKKGNRLLVRATDPGVLYDIPAWCRIHGHLILNIQQNSQEICIEIEVTS